MLARIQKAFTLCIVMSGTLWLIFWWGKSGLTAVLGCLLILFSYAAWLAVGFLILRFVNRRDPAGAPSWTGLLRAWLLEIRVVVQVFFWRQPFRSESVEDFFPKNGRRGVVFIHGFICNRGLWTPWLHELRSQGHAFVAINLEPVFGSIDDYVAIVETAVQRVTKCTGLPPVLVCHSMGGLAARAWLRAATADANVHRIVTIGTPHHGTKLARYSIGINVAQMAISSAWQKELESQEAVQGYEQFICWYSNGDNVVFPASTACLAGADNRHVSAIGHVALAFAQEVMMATMSVIAESNP